MKTSDLLEYFSLWFVHFSSVRSDCNHLAVERIHFLCMFGISQFFAELIESKNRLGSQVAFTPGMCKS